ncbi:MAG: DUF5110 domain-containing protein, partial [Chloroflexi bacterium]|nr:DUF5110 domain-containing protein [Chloroflexota bacterium]
AIYGKLADIPLFAKAGAIVPLGPKVGWGGVNNPEELHIHVFAGADNTFTLYEDDGESTHYRDGQYCQTVFAQTWLGNRLEFTAAPPTGDTHLIPAERDLHLYIHGVKASAQLSAAVNGKKIAADTFYDSETETFIVSGIQLGITSGLQIVLYSESDLRFHRSRKRETLLHMLRFFKLHNGVRNRLAAELDILLNDPAYLAPYIITMTQSQARALFEIVCEAGLHYVSDTQHPALMILWNNNEDERISYRYSDIYLHFGNVQMSNYASGVLPRFVAHIPPVNVWRQGAYAERVHPTQWRAQIDYFNVLTVIESCQEKTP